MGKTIRYDHEGKQLDVDVEPGERLTRSVGFAADSELVEVELGDGGDETVTVEWSVGELRDRMTEAVGLLQSLRDEYESVGDDTLEENEAMTNVMNTYDAFLSKLGVWNGAH